MTERVEFHWSRPKVAYIGAGLLVTAAVGVLIIVYGDGGAVVLGALWIAAILALAALLIRRSRSREAVVVIDGNGIRDIRVMSRTIAWDEIAGLEEIEAEHLRFVGIELVDARRTLAHAGALVRWMRWPNRLLGFPEFSISMHTLDGSTEDVVAAIRAHRPDLAREDSRPDGLRAD